MNKKVLLLFGSILMGVLVTRDGSCSDQEDTAYVPPLPSSSGDYSLTDNPPPGENSQSLSQSFISIKDQSATGAYDPPLSGSFSSTSSSSYLPVNSPAPGPSLKERGFEQLTSTICYRAPSSSSNSLSSSASTNQWPNPTYPSSSQTNRGQTASYGNHEESWETSVDTARTGSTSSPSSHAHLHSQTAPTSSQGHRHRSGGVAGVPTTPTIYPPSFSPSSSSQTQTAPSSSHVTHRHDRVAGVDHAATSSSSSTHSHPHSHSHGEPTSTQGHRQRSDGTAVVRPTLAPQYQHKPHGRK